MKDFLKCFLIGLLFTILMICLFSYIGMAIYDAVYCFQYMLIVKGLLAIAAFFGFLLSSFCTIVLMSVIGFCINDIRKNKKTIREQNKE